MEEDSETRSDVRDSSKRQKTSSTDDWKERLLGHLLGKIVEQDFTAIQYTEGINRFFSSPNIPEEEDNEKEKSFRDQVFRLLHELFGAEARARDYVRADNCLTIVLLDTISEYPQVPPGDADFPNLRRLLLELPPNIEKLVLISEVSYFLPPDVQGDHCFGRNLSPAPPTLKTVVFRSSQRYLDFNYYFSLFRNAESLHFTGMTRGGAGFGIDTSSRFPSRCKHLSLRFDCEINNEDDDDNLHSPYYRTSTYNPSVDYDTSLKSAPIYHLTADLSSVETLSVKLTHPVKYPNLFWRKFFRSMGPESSLQKLRLDISEVVDDLEGERIIRAMSAESARPAQKCTGLRELTILGRQSNEINLNALETLAFILGPQITHLDLSGFQFNYEFAPTLGLLENVTDFRLKFDEIEPTLETRRFDMDNQRLLFDRSLLQVLPTLTRIKRLELDGFYLWSPHCIPVQNLESLVLRESKLKRDSEDELGIEDFLSGASNLRSLRLFDFHVPAKELKDVLRIFPELERLEIEEFKETPYDADTCSQLAKATKAHKNLLQVRINLGDSTVEANLHCLRNRLEQSFEDFWRSSVRSNLLSSILECSDRMAGPSGMYWILKEKLVSDLGFG